VKKLLIPIMLLSVSTLLISCSGDVKTNGEHVDTNDSKSTEEKVFESDNGDESVSSDSLEEAEPADSDTEISSESADTQSKNREESTLSPVLIQRNRICPRLAAVNWKQRSIEDKRPPDISGRTRQPL
jgi:hypothetical protein